MQVHSELPLLRQRFPQHFTKALEGYTDIHCHVLPGVDDGARSMGQALDMLALMYDEGISRVILTPHYHVGHVETPAAVLRKRFEELKIAAASDEIVKKMELFLGSEIYYYPSVTDWLDEGRVLTLADSRYVLLEFGYTMDKRMIFSGVSDVARAGYVPVIAHVERYEGLGYKTENVRELTNMGAYIQINSGAFSAGHRARSFVKKLLKEGLVSFVATDAHDTGRRAPDIRKAEKYITKHFGEEYFYRLMSINI